MEFSLQKEPVKGVVKASIFASAFQKSKPLEQTK
jgi:hypothetical protein